MIFICLMALLLARANGLSVPDYLWGVYIFYVVLDIFCCGGKAP